MVTDAKNWAANGYVEVRDLKTGGTPLHVAAAKGYIDVSSNCFMLVLCIYKAFEGHGYSAGQSTQSRLLAGAMSFIIIFC